MTQASATAAAGSSFLSKAAAVAGAVVKHVPTRAVLWGFIGLVVGAVAATLSYVIGLLVMERGALLLGYLVMIPFALVLAGAALFGMHGLHRGAARAALSIEEKFGLVGHVVDRIFALLTKRFGGTLANLPLAQLEKSLKETVDAYLVSKEDDEGKGLAAWVVRRARKAIALRIETYLLTAYREEQKNDGSGGGVSIEKVRERVVKELSGKLAGLVMSPLNKQLAIFMTLYILLTGGWWFWLFLILSALTKVTGK